MKSVIRISIAVFCISTTVICQNQFEVYFNEIRANDSGSDDIEFIELIGPAGTVITGFKIIHYNGSDSLDVDLWSHTIGAMVIPDDGVYNSKGNAMGYYVLEQKDAAISNSDETTTQSLFLQNGPDGLVLYDNNDNIIDAVAWQGTGDLLIDDPGTLTHTGSVTQNTYLHVLPDDDASDYSLQAPDNGNSDDGSGWSLGIATPGAINENQNNGDASLPVGLSSFNGNWANGIIHLSWTTESEFENLGFIISRSFHGADYKETYSWEIISDFRTNPVLNGKGSYAGPTTYYFSDKIQVKTGEIFYRLTDVNYQGIEHHNKILKLINNPNFTAMHRAYPNPFNPITYFDIIVTEKTKILIQVFNIKGLEVATILDDVRDEGQYRLNWDGKTIFSEPAPSGIYFLQLNTGKTIETQKIVLVR